MVEGEMIFPCQPFIELGNVTIHHPAFVIQHIVDEILVAVAVIQTVVRPIVIRFVPILGFKRNIAAFLASLLIWGIDYYLLIVIFPVGIILPVMFLVSLTQFMGIYAAYPKIKEIMIDPYYVSDDVGAKPRSEAENEDPEPEIEPIFKDRG